MAQLSRLAQLYLKISNNLQQSEDDVRNLKSLLSLDEIFGKAKIEKATPLEIFDMLVDNDMIGKGKLGFLVQILRYLGKGQLADEAERLEQEHKIEAREIKNITRTANSDASEDAQTTPKEGCSAASEDAQTTPKEGYSAASEDAQTTPKEGCSAASEDAQTTPKEGCSAASEDAQTTPKEGCSAASEDAQTTPKEGYSAASEDAQTTPKEGYSAASEDAQTTPKEGYSAEPASRDSAAEETEVKEIISVQKPPGAATTPENHQTTEADTDVHCVTSELASLHIKEMARLEDEPMKAPGLQPSELDSSTDDQDVKTRLETLLAELDTPEAVTDQEKQCDLYCQIGDLYRAKLYNLQSAQQYYESMLNCSKALSQDIKQAKAHNRLGLTYDMLGKHEEAIINHERVLDTYNVLVGNKVYICVSYKNLASSLTLSGKLANAKSNYKSALRLARKIGNRIEEIDIHCKLGDLHRKQLREPQISHKYYTNMLALAKDLGSKYWEMLSYNRLALACDGMQDNEQALEWHLKALKMSPESADKRDEIISHMNIQTTSHLDTALHMAQQKGDQYQQMRVSMHMGDMQKDKFNSPRTSIQYYDQYLTLARQLGDRRQEGRAYNRLGQAHYDMREYEAALEWYEKHLKISQERDDTKEKVAAHVTAGNAYRFMGKIEEAKSHFDTASQMAQQAEDEHGQLGVYISMGDMQKDQFRSPRTSIQYYEKHLALARQLMNSVEEALAYERLGLAQFGMGEYEKAVKWHQKHLDKSQDNGDNKQQIRAHTNLGRAYRLLGSQEKATSHISTALQLAEQTGDLHGQMEVNFSMGEMQRNQLHSPRTAIQYYEQYLTLARQLGDRYKEGLAYNRMGWAHFEMGEHEKALEWFQQYLKMSQESGYKKEEITAHTTVGMAYGALGKVDEATSHFDTALDMAKKTGDGYKQMEVYFSMGETQREQLHSPRTAIQYYERHLTLARQLGNRYEERVAYYKLGHAHSDMREYEKALEWHQKDQKASQEGGDKKEQMTALRNVGNTYRLLGKLDQATSHFNTALQMAQQTGDLHGQMDVYCQMGDMQMEQLHSPRKAIQYYDQYLALARKLEDMHKEVVAYNKLGLAHCEMREYETALEWHQKHLTASQESGDKKEQITALRNVGDTYRLLGNLDQATSHFDTALQMAQQTGDQYQQMIVYCKMGDLQRKQLHSPRTAIQYYDQHLALARQLEDRHEEGVAYNRLGQAHDDMGEYDTALEWHQKYLKASQESGDKKEQITALENVGDTYRLLGKLDEAKLQLSRALQMAQQTGDQYGQMRVYIRMGDLQWEQLRSPRASIQYYEQAVALAGQLNDIHHLGVSYSGLGVAHYDMGEYKVALEWFQRVLKMRQESGKKKGQITAHKNMAASYKALGKLDLSKSHYESAMALAIEAGNKQEQMDIAKIGGHC
ncbi:uncharacterized protein LOC144877577 [Branchiostoma floridae x Branchiostoma japonicum]